MKGRSESMVTVLIALWGSTMFVKYGEVHRMSCSPCFH